ncbi:MAG: IPT/TIG domain-containing protein [Methylococcales bacterium]|nr:IPT/TIG domain-containing protein [Methylococcales bacterium]MDD5631109.1 IPT/TIG domain-containing protein [Methylococcales bacterium]
MKEWFEGQDIAPGKSYATSCMIGWVAFYLVLLTTGTITGLVLLWPSCENPNLTSGHVNELTVTSVSPGFGKTGEQTLLSIRGSGFTDNMTVDFGNAQGLNPKVADSTQLRVTTPSHTKGLVDVVVTNHSNGDPTTSRVLPRGFLYVDANDPPPKPSIDSLKPVSGPLTGGQTVTIKGSGFQNTTMVSFGGLPGTNINVLDDATLVVTTPPHSEGKVDIAVSANGVALAPEGYNYTCWDIIPSHLFLMIILSSALGSSLHGLRSLVWHVGDRNLQNSRLLKYFLLPLIGTAIGVIFFLAVSAGFYTVQGTGNMILIGLSGLVGMFSDEAAVKLKKIAEGLLTEVPPAGKNTPITVASITPKSGSPIGNTEVTILGEAFDEPPIVRFGNKEATVKKCSPNFILVTTPAHTEETVDLTVINKNGQSFTVRDGYEYKY